VIGDAQLPGSWRCEEASSPIVPLQRKSSKFLCGRRTQRRLAMFIVAHPISAGIKGPGMEFFPDGDYLGCEKRYVSTCRLAVCGCNNPRSKSNVRIRASFVLRS
jgi:hypothetical protein